VNKNISIIVAHPNTQSFNHAIACRSAEVLRRLGYSVFYHDLYAEHFDPILPFEEFQTTAVIPETIKLHCNEIANSHGIVIVHPNWWGQPPAILKGWIDRVFRPAVTYQFINGDSGEGTPLGLLKAETAVVFNTSNTRPEREREVFGDPLETIWKNCIFKLCGVRNFHRTTYSVIVTSTSDQRIEWLDDVERILVHHFPVFIIPGKIYS